MDPTQTNQPVIGTEAIAGFSTMITSDRDLLSYEPNLPFINNSLLRHQMQPNIERLPSTTTPATATADLPPPRPVTWPYGEIPVEIFGLITSYLSRSEIKTLRLVCREFESKVSARYFKNVVVPFRPELYGELVRNDNGPRQHPSSALFSNGTRIFESFGPHILRFALSLELDEDALAYPPVKPAQVAVPSFWGIYRWPHQNYARYSDLQGIEQTADETQSMKEALRCLTKVTNMGLCCDAGLGYLTRPDTIARNATTQHPVFSTQNWRRDQRNTRGFGGGASLDDSIVTVTDFEAIGTRRRNPSLTDTVGLQHTVLEKMARDAGYKGPQVDEVIQLLLATENTNLGRIDFDERTMTTRYSSLAAARRLLTERDPHTALLPPVLMPGRHLTTDEDVHDILDAPNRRYALAPANLTRAQKELLLELEWAHRAMIQSYVIAMVDNAAIGCYMNLTTLTFAKIPSCHVHILFRDDFWGCFPNLSHVSLGIIADWRKITKPAPGCIHDENVPPIRAVETAYKLLGGFIGKQRKIESLHFEWICGGEFAPSSFQRNQHILPAPFLADPEAMGTFDAATHRAKKPILNLPHVKHLSLKNCWASPHVFIQAIRQMALSSLEKLELESVSLSGQPIMSGLPFPIGAQTILLAPGMNQANLNHMVTQNGFVAPAHQAHLLPGPPPTHPHAHHPVFIQPMPNLGALGNLPVPLPAAAAPLHVDAPPETLQFPELMTWSGILEHFSPSLNIRQHLGDDESDSDAVQIQWNDTLTAAKTYVPKTRRLAKDETRYKLKCISLKSCGYVCVESPSLNSRGLLPPGAQGVVVPANNQSVPARIMQRSWDKDVGQILPYIKPQEAFNLTHAFRMELGWDSIYPDKLVEEAIADGIDFPGMGRFSGTLEAHSSSSLRNGSVSSSASSVPDTGSPESS